MDARRSRPVRDSLDTSRRPFVRVTRARACAPLFAILALLAGCAASRADRPIIAFQIEPWKYGQAEGRLVVTEHYNIHTTVCDEFMLSALPELMETAFLSFHSLVPPGGTSGEKMPIYLFKTRDEWTDFTRRFTGPRAPEFLRITNGGYSERGVTVIQYVAHQTTFPIMAHEAFHQYVFHHVGPAVPAWLNEGLATYCEGQRWEGQRIREFDPWHNPVRRNSLAEAVVTAELFPLGELLATNAGRVIHLSTKAVSTYYAQLWALMLFLHDGEKGKYAPAFAQLLQNLATRPSDGSSAAALFDAGAAAPADFAAAAPVRPSRGHRLALDANPALHANVAPRASPARRTGEALFRQFISDDLDAFEREFREFMRRQIVEGRRRN